jgi:uncharacterized cofD-like protein
MHPNSPDFLKRLWKKIRTDLRWLTPGMGVKRWVGVIVAGTTLLAIGIAVLLLDVYRTSPRTWWLPILSILSLRFMDRTLRALIFGLSGLGMVLYGIRGLNRALLKPFMTSETPIVETVAAYRRLERGPRIVVIGGGHGLSSLLRGLKTHTNNLTAIVTVADDGGSSGELRKNMGILPPGDIRNCLTAMASDEAMLTQIFQYRFSAGAGLNGHTLGNLFITALTDITGSFEEAVAESGRVLAVRGRVVPSTLHDVRLNASVALPDAKGEVMVRGESQIPKAGGQISKVWLEPNNPLAFPPALQAIFSADLIIVGPGSLYTSLIPNLLVPEIAEALKASRAIKFYVCNVASQPGETEGYTVGDHVRTIEKHIKGILFDLVVCNRNFSGTLASDTQWVRPEPNIDEQYMAYFADLIDDANPWRHDSVKLAQVIMDLYEEKTGPLSNREDSTFKSL